MSTQKTLFDIFQPSTAKRSQSSSTGQKRKSDEDSQEISGPKKRDFYSKWLEEFAWLVYVSTENHMKCKTCLDAYGRSAKSSQAFVHSATNFQRSALVRHQWGNDHAMAVEVQLRSSKTWREGKSSRLHIIFTSLLFMESCQSDNFYIKRKDTG